MADSPFVWGAGGAQLTPGQIADRRKIADAMIAQGTDYSPIKSAWQGAARLAQGLLGGYESGQIDRAQAANEASDRDLMVRLLAGYGGAGAPTTAAGPAPAAAGAPVRSSAVTAPTATLGPDAPAAAVSRPRVLSSARVWGDKEAEDAGIYEKPVAASAAPSAAPAPTSTMVAPAAATSPGVATVAGAMNPAMVQAVTSPYVSDRVRSLGMTMLAQAMKPKERFSQETDGDGNVWNINGLTGERTVALKRDKPEAAPTSVREYEYYTKNFQPTEAQPKMMNYDTWATAKARAAATTINNNAGGGSDKQIFDAFDERSKEARLAAAGLTAIQNARSALNGPGGSITGSAADLRLGMQKAAASLGIGDPEKIINTETFRAAIAPQVASVLKSTVGTANISDADRRFAVKAAGGSIELDRGSINRLLDIMERANTGQLNAYKDQLEAVYPDPVAHKRERALFGVNISAPTAPAAPAGKTSSGVKWQVE